MNQLTTQGIILSRTDFGEADRIITMLTPDYGKVRLMARGVRRLKSKLAGGIELFSVSHITFIKGRGEIDPLISTRLIIHYESIVQDISRTMLGYDLIKMLSRATEDQPEADYFVLLQQAFEALNDPDVELPLIQLWFAMQLLRIGGHTPNLRADTSGQKLAADQTYNFSFDDMAFAPAENNLGSNSDSRPETSSGTNSGQGRFTPNHIKFLRLGFSSHHAKALSQVQGSKEMAEAAAPLVQTMLSTYIRV